MGLEIVERLPLRPVIGIVLEVTEPLPLILPIDVFGRFHTGYYSWTLKAWEVERGNGQLNTCGSVSGNQKALFLTSDRRESQSRMLKKSDSKAAADGSTGGIASDYVEDACEVRTTLAGFFSILQEARSPFDDSMRMKAAPVSVRHSETGSLPARRRERHLGCLIARPDPNLLTTSKLRTPAFYEGGEEGFRERRKGGLMVSCARAARSQTPLVGRAQWEAKQTTHWRNRADMDGTFHTGTRALRRASSHGRSWEPHRHPSKDGQ